MNEEARAIVEALRHLGNPVDVALADCSSCPMQDYPHAMAVECGESCPGVLMLMAADMIEKLSAQLVNQATEYSTALKITTEQRDAAVADLNMCCPCEVCTRSCTYDKVNPYDECADFEWRGVKNDAE